MQMKLSIEPGFDWTDETLNSAIADQSKQTRFAESELVESLLTLAAMVDSARESERGEEENEDEGQIGGVSKCKSEDRFSFFCGWDRLVARYRESCANRCLQSAL